MMFKFTKTRDRMSFQTARPPVSKELSPWEISRVLEFVPELKNPCVTEWTISSLPGELSWLMMPDVRQLEILGEEYFIFWEDGHRRILSASEAARIKDFLKNKTTFRKKTIDFGDLPRSLQKFWDKR